MIRFTFLLSLAFMTFLADGQDISRWESLINAEMSWKYMPGNSGIPSNWKNITFDDDSWNSGPGGIGYGDEDDLTVIAETPSLYIRRNFNLFSALDIRSLELYMDYDDGFVAYINGIRVASANMNNTGEDPAYTSFADNCDHEAGIAAGGVPDKFVISDVLFRDIIHDGENCLAIEIHNCSETSSDMSSSAWLIAGLSGTENQYYTLPSWFLPPPDGTSHLPLVIIETGNTEIPDEPKIDAFMKVIDNGPGRINHFDDPGTDYEGLIGIEVRGQSSQYFFPKDSYSLETRDSFTGEDLKAGLLGMPEESDWILHAPYSDKTLLRNALSYHLGELTGNWAPRFKYCEVYINGDYRGIYLLLEKIKRDGDRVDISRMSNTHNSGDSLTGGYIVRVDKTGGLSYGADYFLTNPSVVYPGSRTYAVSYYYPEADKITSQQKSYIQNFFNTAETSLNGSNFKDPASGYAKYLDVLSFIDFEILQELGNNVDGYRYSTYFYKDKDSRDNRLHAGPLWDFNLCYGNVNYADRFYSTSMWSYTNWGTTEGQCMHWWVRLMQDSNYSLALKFRYSRFRDSFLSDEYIMNYIDETVQYLGDAIDRNFERWPVIGTEIWPNKFIGQSYEEEIDFFKNWIESRLIFMDNAWYIPLGMENSALSDHFKIHVYPNPFTDYIILEFEADDFSEHPVVIYNISGSTVYEGLTGNQDQIDLRGLEKGIYLLKTRTGSGEWLTQKIIRQ